MNIEYATLGAGCFWGVEYLFKKLPGVLTTEAGYCGGQSTNPSYKDVKTGMTGYAEVIHLTFDPSLVSYETILEYFWRLHDPTQLNRQGVDVGTQYRSVIFYHNELQKEKAELSKQKFDQSGVFTTPAVTQIINFSNYFKAEEYHQDYFNKNGGDICHIMRPR